jgi:pyruvate dehydrogenase E2 component (dihydrolipoamide acetyltransferase)
MPRLGMTMQEGKVLAWPVPLGGRVERGQVVLVIESEKAEVEVEAATAGFLRHLYVQPDADRAWPCGALLAALTETADEPFDAEAFARAFGGPPPAPPRPAAQAPAAGTAPAAGAAPAPRGRPVVPAARALARRHGVDPEAIPGSGPGGRVTVADVEAWLARRAALVEVAPGVRLEVPAAGAGEPVVFLPGFGADASSFSPQSAALAARFRALGVNPRGVGLSDAPEAEVHEVAQAAADALAAAPGPAHVVGASLGAAAALELALRDPGRVRSLTLITPFVEAGPRLLAVLEGWCALAREASPAALGRALLPWLFSPAFLSDAPRRERTARGLAEMLARVPARTLERQAAGLRAWSGSRAGELARIAAPTLVLVAGGDLLTPDGEAVARAIPGARAVIVPAAGHALALEAPDAVTRELLAHVAAARGIA